VAIQIFFIFTPTWGKDDQFDEHIFQMGLVKNHQLDEFRFFLVVGGWKKTYFFPNGGWIFW